LETAVELDEANEIARRILTKQNVSQDEFRYAVMFNLTAMTQLLWELSNVQGGPSKNKPRTARAGSYAPNGPSDTRKKVIRLVPLAALAAFLAGLGLGYMIP
jgi:hypothetical protein